MPDTMPRPSAMLRGQVRSQWEEFSKGNCCKNQKAATKTFANSIAVRAKMQCFGPRDPQAEKLGNAKPEILKRNSRILEISVSRCSLHRVFAPKFGLCDNFAIAPSPPSTQIPWNAMRLGMTRRCKSGGVLCFLTRKSLTLMRKWQAHPRGEQLRQIRM